MKEEMEPPAVVGTGGVRGVLVESVREGCCCGVAGGGQCWRYALRKRFCSSGLG